MGRAIAVLVMSAGTALAQGTRPAVGPLGDGRILQRDLSVLAPEARPRDFAAEARYRNAIVTGSAVGGVSFRGSVGYSDPLGFRGALGSEDLFEFRRDSVLSGLAGSGVRGTDALQYQFAMSTGGVTPLGLTGSLTVQRGMSEYAARSGAMRRTDTRADSFTGVGALGISQGAEGRVGTLRSTSAYLAGRGLIPGIVGYRVDPATGRSEPVSASPVTGVQWWGLSEEEKAQGRRRELSGALAPAPEERPKTGFELMRERLMRELGVPDPTATVPAAPTGPAPSGLGTPAPMPDEGSRARDGMLSLRNRLLGLAAAEGSEIAARMSAVKTMLLAREEEGLGQSRRPGSWTEAEGEAVEAIRRAGSEPVPSLVGAGLASKDAFVIHLSAGERYLKEGRYFDAEERFARALVIRSGDQASLVGRLHAQLGAGMVMSASLNLRELFAEHPESVPVKYGADLMPSARRQEELVTILRGGISGGGMERQSGLLLAYLGHQRGEPALIEEGLVAFARLAPSPVPTEAEAQEARATVELTALLRQMWLGGEGR
ncbi:MAG: hypothetical protein FJ255_08890 [Phycisphaerae bacterium]|nr:hypothetical protein [Phycisphaerae bacterium]